MAARQSLWTLIKCAFSNWSSDQAATTGAALAFYCAFSLAPLLIILITVTGWFIGTELAYGQMNAQLTALFGPATAKILAEAASNAKEPEGIVATALSFGTLLLGATTVFSALENALENMWGARKLVPSGFKGWLRSRVLSFGVILAVGFLLLVSLTVSTALSSVRESIARHYTGFVVVIGAVDFIVSLSLMAGLFALIYRYMPARRMPWQPVLWGGLVTALLFQLGRWAVGLYLASSTQASAFGAAASFAALLLWLYYTAQIFLLGAEFTACLGGRKKPDDA